jgi:hypothetical protein
MGQATKIAELVAKKWDGVLQSSAIKILSSKAGTVVGAIYGAAMGAATRLAEVVSALFLKLPFAPQVRAAVLAASIELGTLQATTMGKTIAAAFAAAPLIVPLLLVPTLQGFLPDITGKNINKQAADVFDRLRSGQPLTVPLRVEQNVETQGKSLGQTFSDALQAALDVGRKGATGQVEKYGDAMIAAAKTWHGKVAPTIHEFVGKIKDDLAGEPVARAARRAALLIAGEWGRGFRDSRDLVDQAWTDMLEGIKHPISVTKEFAKLAGRLASEELIKGWKSADPAVRDQTKYTTQLIIDRLWSLKPRTGIITKAAMDELVRASNSKIPDVRNAANAILETVRHPIEKLPGIGTTVGTQTGRNLTSAMQRAISTFRLSPGGIFDLFHAFNPFEQHRAFGGPVQAGVPYTVGEFRPETFIPDVPGTIVPFALPHIQAAEGSIGGNVTQQFTTYVTGSPLTPATPFETVRQLRRGIGGGGFMPRRRTAWRPAGG